MQKLQQYPIIPCNLCGSQEGMQRQVIKKMLADWDENQPGRVEKIFKSMRNIATSHMLDTNIYDFKNLQSNVVDDEKEKVV